MIKANELRIGNWANIVKSDFNLEKGNRKLEGISLHYIEMGVIEVEGIPLTEEILLKCGFVQAEYDKTIYKYKDFIWFRVEKEFTNGNNEYISANLRGVNAGDFLRRLDYVHQLQNLFHSLTNEELQIEL